MLCRNPYVKVPSISEKAILLTEHGRAAATPYPCGQCLPCRINKSRMWTLRILLESLCHPFSIFITLTYDNDHLPDNMEVKKSELQNFFKRLRNRLIHPIRYYAVGEYGSISLRPHYHAMIFGLSRSSYEKLEVSWGKGFVYLGDVTPASAAYITGYIIKGQFRVDQSIGKPEFSLSSRQEGGIGVPALYVIADDMIRQKKFKTYLKEVRIGKKLYMLDRYMRIKYLRILGDKLDDAEFFDMVNAVKNQREVEIYDYQESVFSKYGFKGNLKRNIIETEESSRRAFIKKKKLFQARKSL